MKRLTAIFTILLITFGAYSQVELGKVKNTIMGKGKLVATPFEEIMFDNFTLTFNLYSFAEDQGGSNNVALSAKVGVRASLDGVDQELVQEITDEAYAYFTEAWRKRGKRIVFVAKSDVENSKLFTKAKAKGKLANVINGGVWENEAKNIHQMTSWPTGVDIPQAGEGINYKSGNAAFVANYMDMKYTSYNATIDFITFKTAKLGSAASVKTFPQLKLSGGMNATIWKKNKVGGYLGGISADGLEEYYTEVKDEDIEVLNSKMVMRSYVIDRAKFKANVLEMIKASIDASFDDYEEVVAKNT